MTRFRNAAAGLGLTLALAGGCTSGGETAHSPATTSTTSAAPETTTSTLPSSTNAEMEAFDYTKDPTRNQMIADAVHKFGTYVLGESAKGRNNVFGGFDAYCSDRQIASAGKGPEGWVSEGYQPQPGDVCNVQHNRQYGGSQDLQVDASVIVGDDGKYTDQFIGTSARNNDCSATFNLFEDGSWGVSIGNGNENNYSAVAGSVEAVKAIDVAGIACLSQLQS